jgi:serine/threonine protein phosphatase PrpC
MTAKSIRTVVGLYKHSLSLELLQYYLLPRSRLRIIASVNRWGTSSLVHRNSCTWVSATIRRHEPTTIHRRSYHSLILPWYNLKANCPCSFLHTTVSPRRLLGVTFSTLSSTPPTNSFQHHTSNSKICCKQHHYHTASSETASNMKSLRQASASFALVITAATVLAFQPVSICRAERYRFFSSSKTHKESVDVVTKNDSSNAAENDKEVQQSKQWVETSTNLGERKNDNPSCPFYGCPLLPVDVHYNTAEYKEALTVMRDDKRVVVKNKEAAAILSSSANDQHATLTLIGYKGGALQGQINQDRALIIAPYSVVDKSTSLEETFDAESKQKLQQFLMSDRILLGVFDGHAPLGEKVSEYVTVELPKLLAEKLLLKAREFTASTEKGSTLSDQVKVQLTKDALSETFIELDSKVPADPSGGCTASIILKQEGKVYVANAGDSRSFVAAYRPSTKNVTIAYISREDKPCLPDERARVEARGGQVYIPSRGTSRVVYHDPITGAPTGLAMSRSIGDWEAGKMGVIPDPIVDVLDINNVIANVLLDDIDDEQDSDSYQVNPMLHSVNGDGDDVYLFAVSATDGMMDYLSAIEISRVLAHSLFDDSGAHPVTAVEHLIFAAANAWQEAKQGRYRDDIAIAVSVLHQPQNRSNGSNGASATINSDGNVDIGE